MTRAEACDTVTLLLWAAGRNAHYGPVADVVAEQAAKRLAARARKTLGTSPVPDGVRFRARRRSS